MRTKRFGILMLAGVIVFSIATLIGGTQTAVWATSTNDPPSVAAEVVEPAASDPAAYIEFKDERVAAIEEQYAAEIDDLEKEIEQQSNFMEREKIQQTIQTLKTERERDLAELYLDMAVEKDDEEKIAEFTRIIDELDSPGVAQQNAQDPRQPVDAGGSPGARVKQPDEM